MSMAKEHILGEKVNGRAIDMLVSGEMGNGKVKEHIFIQREINT